MPLPNVTRIEDLPELSDIENSYKRGESGMGNVEPKMNKYIRNHSRQDYNNNNSMNNKNSMNNSMNNNNSMNMKHINNFEPYQGNKAQIYIEEQPIRQKEFYEPTPLPTKLNCLDVCNHIKDCPLCSKFYHNDNTLYIIIIVVLLILTIILSKKVLNL